MLAFSSHRVRPDPVLRPAFYVRAPVAVGAFLFQLPDVPKHSSAYAGDQSNQFISALAAHLRCRFFGPLPFARSFRLRALLVRG